MFPEIPAEQLRELKYPDGTPIGPVFLSAHEWMFKRLTKRERDEAQFAMVLGLMEGLFCCPLHALEYVYEAAMKLEETKLPPFNPPHFLN